MKITTKREIYAEHERRVTIRFADRRVSHLKFCHQCQRGTYFITVDEAAVVREKTAREVFRAVEHGQIHALDTSEGFLIICLESLKTAKFKHLANGEN